MKIMPTVANQPQSGTVVDRSCPGTSVVVVVVIARLFV
jgi:hypothetical protein